MNTDLSKWNPFKFLRKTQTEKAGEQPSSSAPTSKHWLAEWPDVSRLFSSDPWRAMGELLHDPFAGVGGLIAGLVIGFINATIGFVLKIITFPLTLLTLGLFWFVINALMLEFASALLAPGFQVHGFLAAFVGAIVLSLINMLMKAIIMPRKDIR